MCMIDVELDERSMLIGEPLRVDQVIITVTIVKIGFIFGVYMHRCPHIH